MADVTEALRQRPDGRAPAKSNVSSELMELHDDVNIVAVTSATPPGFIHQ